MSSHIVRQPTLQLLTEALNLSQGGVQELRGFVRKLSTGGKDIPRGCVLELNTVQDGVKDELVFKPATATASSSFGKLLYVNGQALAASFADASDLERRIHRPVLEELVIPFDTNGASAGDYVYLTDAQATNGHNISLTPGTNTVPVGYVVGTPGTSGKVFLCPQRVAAKYAQLETLVPPIYGDVTAANAATYAEVVSNAKYDGGTIVYSRKGVTGAATSVATGWSQVGTGASTKFRIALDAAPTSGKSVTFSYVIYPAA